MASVIEQRNFVDKDGLEQFWDDIQLYLTRKYKELPPGMQFSRIYQENGRLHILVEPFGGATEAAKAAARASLGVGSYKGQKTLTEMNELTQEPNAGDQYNVVFPGTGFGTLVNQWDGEDPHTTVDILSGDNVVYNREGHCWDRQTGNYKTRQTPTSETMAEYQTILDIFQNENGEISITTQTIPTATVSKLGLTTLKGVIGSIETDNSTAATPKAVRDAIDTAIGALDVTEVTFGPVQTVGTIEEVDGKIVVTPVDIRTATTSVSGITTLTSDTVDQGALVDTETMAVTPLGVKNAIESLDVSTITGFGADKTLSALSETDGKISASFQSILAGEDNIDTGAVTENKIGAGAVTEGKIGAGAVTENKIGAEAVTNTKIASNAVDTRTILDSAVTTGKINDKAVTTEKIADGAVTTDKLDATNGIDGSVLKDRSVTGIKIAKETITGSSWDPVAQQVHISNIKPGTISGREIATGNNDGINTANIVDHAITSDKLATGSVNTAHIIDAAVTTDKLYDGAVTTGKIGAQAVTAEKLATDSVTTTKILNGAVTTDKLELQAVTSATIADLNVTTGKIADDAVTTVKIADGNVTSAKIADGNVTEGKLGTDSVTTEKIKDENVTESKLATDSVTTDKIKNGNVTEGKIADGAVSRDKLAANAVTPAKVSSGTYGIDISGTAEYATHASGELATTLGNKADKKVPSQAGNLATLDATGNLADSGIQPGNFKTKQTAVEDPAASGNSYSFIDTLSQDANGEVTVTKKTVPDATTAVRGVSQLNSSTVITTNDSSSLSEDETKAVTALGVKNAIDNLDSGDSKVETKVVRAVNVTNGKIAVTKDTLGISDIDQLGTRLGNIESGKADKVANATSGNFASLDSNGNLVDSGSKAADFVQMTDLQALDLAEIGGPGEYISAIKQENGQVSATATTMDTEPTANSTNAVTSGGVRSAIDGAIAKLDVSDSAVSHQFVTAVPEADGKVSVSRAQPVIADVDGLQTELNSKQNTLTFEDTYGDYNPDTNPVPTVASITSRLGELDLDSQGGADGNYISQISQTDGQVAVTVSSTIGTLDTTSNAPVNSSAVNSAITGAIAALDKSDISGFGAGKTLASLSETDGIISAEFQDITVGSSNISDGSITTPKLDQQAVTTEKIADDAITPAKVSNDTYTISIDGDAATASDAKDGSTLANKLADLGSDKADKVANATSGNFAGLDSNGNLTDSGKKASDFKTVQTAVSDPAASGTSTTFISGISQDTNGVITPSKANLPEASTTVKGIVQLKDGIGDTETESGKAATPKSVRDAINALDVNSLTGFGQDKTLATLTETDGKISATFQPIVVDTANISNDAVTADKVKDGATFPVNISGNAATASDVKAGSSLATALDSKEDKDNKSQTISSSDTGLTTKYPSVQAVVDFVNSSIATNTANFLGNKDVVDDLHLTTSATNQQIATALGAYVWPSGTTPTNNDYVFVTVDDLTTAGVDEYRRFKYNGTDWAYEYTLNNSTFTQAQWDAINSGLSSTDKTAYDTHVADGDIHVTPTDKAHWNGKADLASTVTDVSVNAAGSALTKTVGTDSPTTVFEIDGEYGSANKIATVASITTEINKLDVSSISGFGADKTLSALSETDGKISAAFQSILVDTANIKDDAVTAAKVKDGETLPVNISGDAAGYSSGGAIDTALSGKSSTTHTHQVKINGTTKTIAATGGTAVDLGTYLTEHQDISGKADKTTTVTNVAYDTTGKKLTKTINGTTSDVVSVSTLKTDMALNNVNNTSDADKPISTATQSALDLKEDKANKVAAWSSTASDTNYPSEKLVKGSLDNKVDKVTGKWLSTNDYTTAEKNKLSGIEAGAEVNQNAFSSVKVGTDTIQADTKTDTLTLVAGSNVQLAADTATDTVTISATDTTYGADRGISLVSGKFGHSNAAVTGASVGPSDAVTGVSVSVPRFTFDGYGHVTAASDKTFTVRSGSTSQIGVVQLQGSIGATESENGKAATPKAVRDAINALDVASVGGSGNVIVSISEENGKISATAGKLSASGGALSYSGEIDEDFCLKLSNVVFTD